MFSSGVMAATGTGHAQVELTNPLTVANIANVNFGTIAIDPAAGAQTVSMAAGTVTCPATYVCSGTTNPGNLLVTGAPSTGITIDVTGSTATLSDGSGNSLTFVPYFAPGVFTLPATLAANGTIQTGVSGTIDFAGTEVAGTYNTTNAGGSGYTITVNY
ncbi:MAG: DUF4402 domain-containing protein, partial [Alphaproteobacteria bacterium]|nr:DUF4402 domain-containing protein [Alphaproteobacteria bacterium]